MSYPKLEIEQEEFNVYVVRYDSFFQRTTLERFPYGYESDDQPLADAIQQAKDFVKEYKVKESIGD